MYTKKHRFSPVGHEVLQTSKNDENRKIIHEIQPAYRYPGACLLQPGGNETTKYCTVIY